MNAAPGLSYLLAHPDNVGVAVSHPALLLLLLVAPLFAVLGRRDTRLHRLALGLRTVAFVMLVVVLSGVALTSRLPSDQLSVIALVDRSQSIDQEGRRWQERYLAQVAGGLAPDDELGVVTFAAEPTVLQAPGAPHAVDAGDTPGVTSATDIGRALETGLALFPPDRERRLLLLSDGNETRGDSSSRIAQARAAAVAVYASVPPHAGGVDVAVEKLAVPPLVAEGSVFPLRVVVRNHATARPAALALFVDGEPLGSENVFLQPGLNAVEIPYRMTGPGSHRLRAQIRVPDDVVAGNDYREATVMVGGKSRVLLVTSRPRSPLAGVFERKDINATLVTPAEFPTTIDGLLSYHCVIFEDTAAAGFNLRKLDVLERYIKDFGGGFILVAGERSYGDSAFKKTALERILPVSLEPRRPPRAEREPLALFLVIDRSNSMGYHIHNRLERSDTQSKLEYAKRAALAVVGQLKDTDLVGLIAFDSQPFEVAPLRPLKENRVALETDLPRLAPGGGTDFYDALDSARQQLVNAHASIAHTILLTDGDTNRGAADHYPLIDALTKGGISVTTIRIGDDTVNLQLLHDISSRTGGQFYHVENAEMLPQLLLKDTSQMLAQGPRQDETFAPRLAAVSQALRGIKQSEIPELHGYAFARIKPGADVLLQIVGRDKKDPLLAAWQYGLGRVVAFTASLDDDAETWVGWDGFGKLWSQLVHWAVREQTPWDYALDVQRADGQTTLTVHAFGDLDDATLTARIFAKPDHPVDVPLVPRAPRMLVGHLPSLPGGRYPLTLTTRSSGHDINQRTEFVQIPAGDAEPQEEFDASGPDLPLLQALTSGTGGAIDAPIRTLVGRKPGGTRRLDHPLDWLLIPAAMLCFLADVGIRRFYAAPSATPLVSDAVAAH